MAVMRTAVRLPSKNKKKDVAQQQEKRQ